MFEARLSEAIVLKKVVDAVKELVFDANFYFTDSGISLQALVNSNVAVIILLLRADGFDSYRCDHMFNVGINVDSLSKIVKTALNDDILTIKMSEDMELLNLVFECQSKSLNLSE